MKRIQECSWYEKLWRYRFYIRIPFEWVWIIIKSKNTIGYKQLWGILIGTAQVDMGWTYTMDEFRERTQKFIQEKLKEKSPQ
jgi:hypothetical protein